MFCFAEISHILIAMFNFFLSLSPFAFPVSSPSPPPPCLKVLLQGHELQGLSDFTALSNASTSNGEVVGGKGAGMGVLAGSSQGLGSILGDRGQFSAPEG